MWADPPSNRGFCSPCQGSPLSGSAFTFQWLKCLFLGWGRKEREDETQRSSNSWEEAEGKDRKEKTGQRERGGERGTVSDRDIYPGVKQKSCKEHF